MLVPSQIDLTVMKQASGEAEKALYLVIKPKEESYTLLLATLQQLGDNRRCADLLELMVKKFPNNKTYWPMLFNTYVALQGSGDKTVDISAVVALERAQAAGQMVSNKDNFMLAGLYYNIQQYAFAAELLEKGLRNGKIDSEQKNWELLAACYQQMNREARAIEVFLETIKLFPKSPNLELQVGQIYYNNDKHDEAYKHFQAAVSKGLEHPGQTLVLISYLALEDKRLDDALVAAEKAVIADPKSKEAQNILKVVKESIIDRDNFLKNKK
jgi:tetratricopeptide (TPR) repeat protein